MSYPDLGWGEVTAEQVQKVALTTFAYEFGEVVSTKQLLQRLRGQDCPPHPPGQPEASFPLQQGEGRLSCHDSGVYSRTGGSKPKSRPSTTLTSLSQGSLYSPRAMSCMKV